MQLQNTFLIKYKKQLRLLIFMEDDLRMDNLVWHYTSLEVAEKIFLEKENEPRMRATHFQDFDDKDEIVRGARVFLEKMRENRSETKDWEYDFLEKLTSGNRYLDNYYILSFCEKRDHICQWINYANKDEIGGCAIGFIQNSIAQIFVHKIDAGNHGAECYTPVFNQPLQCTYIDDISSRTKNLSIFDKHKEFDPYYFEEVNNFSQLLAYVCKVKKQKFDFEKEWRLIFRFRSPKIHKQLIEKNPYPYLSDSNSHLYCPFNFEQMKKAIPEIMLAPNADVKKGREIIAKINNIFGTNIKTTIGEATKKDCPLCHRHTTLLEKGKCNI